MHKGARTTPRPARVYPGTNRVAGNLQSGLGPGFGWFTGVGSGIGVVWAVFGLLLVVRGLKTSHLSVRGGTGSPPDPREGVGYSIPPATAPNQPNRTPLLDPRTPSNDPRSDTPRARRALSPRQLATAHGPGPDPSEARRSGA